MSGVWFNDAHDPLWPDCPTDGCTNKTCTVLDSTYCFPCTMKRWGMDPAVGRTLIKARREATFGVGCDAEMIEGKFTKKATTEVR